MPRITPGLVSETVSDSRRGRPRDFSPHVFAVAQEATPSTTTRRGLQNTIFRLRALSVLEPHAQADEGLRWLLDVEAYLAGRPRAFRAAVLSELGRIPDEDALLDVARWICGRKPATTREAVALVRRVRLEGQARPLRAASAEGLTLALAETIDAYAVRHEGVTSDVIVAALTAAYHATQGAPALAAAHLAPTPNGHDETHRTKQPGQSRKGLI